MKKIYLIIFVLSVVATGLKAQQPAFRWADGLGGPAGTSPAGDEYAVKFVTDSSGNMYVIGHFTGTADFDPGPGTVNLVSTGDSDIFVAKYAASGNLMWNFRIGGSGPDEGLGIALYNDLIYITGAFSGTGIEFDPIIGGTLLSSNGAKDIFIANFDTTGFLIWAKNIGAGSNDIATSIAVDDSGSVLLTGSFSGSVDFDPGPGTVTLNTGGTPSDAFLAKYSASGAYKWAFDFGGGTSADAGVDVTTDDSGNVFATGQFQSTNIDFDPSASTAYLTSRGSYDAYVASYDSLGNYRWAFNIGGFTIDRSDAIAIDNEGNVLVTGKFSGSNVDFDPGTGTMNLNSPNGNDVFIAKYDNNGNYLWAKQVGGSATNEEGLDITSNAYNNYVIVTGYFAGTVDFDPSAPVANLTSYGGDDAFVASYEPNGAYAWAFKVGGASTDNGTCVVSYLDVDTIKLYVGGNFSATADFDPGAGSANLNSVGGRDLFFAQYVDPFTVGIPQISSADHKFLVYPNPASTILNVDFRENVREGDLRIADLQGKIVKSLKVSGTTASLDLGALDAGVYILSLSDAKSISHSRFTVVR